MSLKNLVKGQTAVFIDCRNGTLFYEIVCSRFRFGVPVNELDGATVKAEENAAVFLKWIRKAYIDIKLEEVKNAEDYSTSQRTIN